MYMYIYMYDAIGSQARTFLKLFFSLQNTLKALCTVSNFDKTVMKDHITCTLVLILSQ